MVEWNLALILTSVGHISVRLAEQDKDATVVVWSWVRFSVMASSTEIGLFMRRIWKRRWQLYHGAE